TARVYVDAHTSLFYLEEKCRSGKRKKKTSTRWRRFMKKFSQRKKTGCVQSDGKEAYIPPGRPLKRLWRKRIFSCWRRMEEFWRPCVSTGNRFRNTQMSAGSMKRHRSVSWSCTPWSWIRMKRGGAAAEG